ncbi:MAG: hypothetical protein WA970_25750, partial [Gammaproteobacteria bacterium]
REVDQHPQRGARHHSHQNLRCQGHGCCCPLARIIPALPLALSTFGFASSAPMRHLARAKNTPLHFRRI